MRSINIKKQTEYYIQDLHAREAMRLGWYRQLRAGGEQLRRLRERKAQHSAFLLALLRRRELGPAWYAFPFYMLGSGLGLFMSLLPARYAQSVERTLEYWILVRYRRYHRRMDLDFSLRSMIEATQLHRLHHDEPAPDVRQLLEQHIRDEEQLLHQPASSKQPQG